MRIAVVGAGCAGSVAAWRLAEAGLAPVLLERDAAPGDSAACGGVMLHALAGRLQLPAELLFEDVHRVTLLNGRRRRELVMPRPAFVNFDRRRLDRFLAERAERSGAELRCGCHVTGWDPGSGRLSWAEAGRTAEAPFDVVVFADGPRSVARRHGLGPPPDAPAGVAFYRELEGSLGDEATCEFHLGLPADQVGYLWVFPKGGAVQVGVGRLQERGDPPLRDLVDRFVAADPRLAGRPVTCSRGGIVPLATGRRLSCPGALAVGDAAGLVNPVTGGGLVYAVASGEIAARSIVRCVRGGLDRVAIARDAERRWALSIHAGWLRLFGVLLAVCRRRPGLYPPLLRVYLEVLPVLAPLAGVLARRQQADGRQHSRLS